MAEPEAGSGSFSRLSPPPVPSLQAICLGVLALHLQELLECGDDVLPFLPADAKGSLLAAARRRRELTDVALRLLADQEHTILDVHNACSALSSPGILAAGRIMSPSLRFVDLSGCSFRPRFLLSLAAASPCIEVLRFGGSTSLLDCEEIGESLIQILPRLEQDAEAVADSWEVVAEESAGARDGRNASSQKRLMNLSCIHWPEIPLEVKNQCAELAPAVFINPSAAEVAARKLPLQCNPDMALDAAWAAEVAGLEAWKNDKNDGADSILPAQVVHIAERFRLAYESQEKRLQKKDQRVWRKATRESLAKSGGERAIWEWEYGL